MTGGSLSGLTVLEYPGGVATRYCGRLFAAHGATVLQAAPPDETGVGYGGRASRAYARWLDSGKQLVPRAGGKVDLVLAGQTPAAVERADAALRAAGRSSGWTKDSRQATAPSSGASRPSTRSIAGLA